MMQFTFESPKQFKRITTRLQRVFQSPDIWFPWNSEEETIKIKSVSSQEYETMVSSVKSIHVGEKLINPKSGDVFYEIVLFAENNYYLKKNRDKFLIFEHDLAELLEYFDIK